MSHTNKRYRSEEISPKALCFSWWALDICMLRKWSFLCGSYFAFLCNLCSSRSYFGTISIRCQHFWDSGSIPCAHFAAIGSLCWERPALQALSRIWPNLRWNLSMRNSKTGDGGADQALAKVLKSPLYWTGALSVKCDHCAWSWDLTQKCTLVGNNRAHDAVIVIILNLNSHRVTDITNYHRKLRKYSKSINISLTKWKYD